MLVSIHHHQRACLANIEADPGATLADLADALGVPAESMAIDGPEPDRWAIVLAVETPLLSALSPGSRLDLLTDPAGDHERDPAAPASPSSIAPPCGATLLVCGGLHAGTRHPLTREPLTVGRSARSDVRVPCPTLSPQHLEIGGSLGGLTVRDLGSTNGTHLDRSPVLGSVTLSPHQTVRAGATRLRVEVTPSNDTADLGGVDPTDGRRAFDRPPCMTPPPPPAPIAVPVPPARPGGHSPFSWALFVCPLAIGLVLAVLLSPLFAVFALLSPVMVAASWFETRRRERRGRRLESRRFARALDEFEAVVTATARHARQVLVDEHPDPAEVVRRATDHSTRLWARRRDHPRWLHLRIGTGGRRWEPDLAHRSGEQRDPSVEAILTRHRLLDEAPTTIDAARTRVVGVCGPPGVTRQVVRALVVDAAVHHGPADLAVCVDGPTSGTWSWVRWLPHHRDPAPPSASTRSASNGAPSSREVTDDDRHLLVVTERAGALRPGTWLRDRADRDGHDAAATILVLAATREELPSQATAIIEAVDRFGTGTVTGAVDGCPGELQLDGLDSTVADHVGRHLAQLSDTEHVEPGGTLPPVVRFADLAGMDPRDDSSVRHRWHVPQPTGVDLHPWGGTTASETSDGVAPAGGLAVPLGMGTDGPCIVDLTADGPHALVAGTTGSGKSELLRTLVAGIALHHSPRDVTFVLVDYKGGSAFDACAALPHTVGVVTDLDGVLGERAVRSLEAELRHRERSLRLAGASDLDAYRRARRQDPTLVPLPRLVVVVDEFAVLARELPTVLDAIVDVAQRGRSLGVHLVLATQRPSGVVNDQIRTNTNLRICLRVLDPSDANDVVGTPDAATLPVHPPGRALVARGGRHAELIQVACVSGSPSPTATVRVRPVDPTEVHPRDWARTGIHSDAATDADLGLACPPVDPHHTDGEPDARTDRRDAPDAGTDLAHLVQAATVAWQHEQRSDGTSASPPGVARRVWIDPLPARIELADIPAVALGAADAPGRWALGVADDPDHQCRRVSSWHPDDGPLLVLGIPGSGRSTAVETLVRSMAAVETPERLHCHVVGDPKVLGDLAALDHVGAVVDPDDSGRLQRLLATLPTPSSAHGPRRLLVVDGLRTMLDSVDRAAGLLATERLVELLAGRHRELGVVIADRLGGVPTTLMAAAPRKLLLRLPDAHDYALFGVAPTDPRRLRPGRGFDVASGLEVQLATTDGAVPRPRGFPTGPSEPRRPDPLDVLAPMVPAHAMPSSRVDGDGTVHLVIGLVDHPREPATLTLANGEHLLITGPDGSGRSMALTRVVTSLSDHQATTADGAPELRVLVSGPPRSSLRDHDRIRAHWIPPADLGSALVAHRTQAPTLLVVDDADLLDDADGSLRDALARPDGLRVVAAAHPERLRVRFDHWARALGLTAYGLALQPDPADAALWATTFPTRSDTEAPPGRGLLVHHGRSRPIQVIHP